MSQACACNVTLSNTGTPSCQPIQKVARKLILVPIQQANGTLNRLTLGSLPNAAAITALVNQADDKARWYPLPKMENITNERAEPIKQEFDSGNTIFIRDGVKTFKGEVVLQDSVFASKLDGLRCYQMGAYVVDADASLIGSHAVAGYLAPMKINMGTWTVETVDATDTTVAMVRLSFQWDNTLADGDIRKVLESDFGSGVDLLGLDGLIDIYGTASAISATAFTMKIETDYGSVENPVPVEGLVLADFALANLTVPASITITSVTETSAGVYTFVIPSQTSAHVLALSLAPAVTGYDDTNLTNVAITIP